MGHLAGLAQGAVELTAVTTGEIGGGILALSGIGTVTRVPTIAVSTAVGVHGVSVGANSGSNLLADIREMSAGKGYGGSGKSSAKGSEPSADKSVEADAGAEMGNPVFEVSKDKYPNHSKVLENAQGNGHSLENLERGGGTREAQKNRYEAQKQIRKEQGPPRKGYDYDEFPYTSTINDGAGAR